MKLSIIIISFNTKNFLEKCLTSVKDSVSGKLGYEVIVVDNNSKDGSKELVANNFPEVKLIENDKNLGFSKANNIGVKKAKGDYVLFLNSDTIVYKETLERMISFMDKNQDVGASTCKVLLANGRIDDASHRGFPTPWNAFCHFSGASKLFPKSKLCSGYHLGFLDLNTEHEIDALAGAFMLVRRKAGNDVKWWDEDYFFYGEDIEFCYQLKKHGWKIYYVPDVSIFHYKGVSGGIKKVSSGITPADEKTKQIAKNARFKAMETFYEKNYKDKYPKFLTKLVILGISLKKKTS